MISLIVATGENREIGKDGVMPWHIPKDLKYFKNKTEGNTIVMGRTTFEHLPGVLPNRKTIVLTRDIDYKVENENVIIKNNMEEIIEEYKNSDDELFIAGGSEIYKQFLPYCDRIYITKINKSFDADTYFPEIDPLQFNLISRSKVKIDEDSGIEFAFYIYDKYVFMKLDSEDISVLENYK